MRVAVLRLYDAIRTLAWRHGFFASERVRHEVRPDGSHFISLDLKANEVEYTPPKRYPAGPAAFGRAVGAKPDEGEKE